MIFILIVCWLTLLLLTQAGIDLVHYYPTLWAWVMLLAAIKGWLIIDCFMGLRQAPRRWRFLLLSWPTALAITIVLFLHL